MSAVAHSLKATLRLPKTKFPARASPESLYKYTRRCSDELYAWQLRNRPATSPFVLHDGPPYANGDLHAGHALNKITKDIICRTKLAEGKQVNYVPGWDCHGLPIELKALEKHGWERGSGVSPVKIRGAARGFAAKTVEKQMKGFRSWGVMGDWDNHWKTMDADFELRQLEVFKTMAEHGLITRRMKPVYWSPSSQTALAEAEIERDDHTSTAAIVKFRIPAVVAGLAEPVHAVIWTTTPWTLPANQAIAINKNTKYVLVRSKTHGSLVVALSRVNYLSQKLKEEIEMLKVIDPELLLASTYSGLSQFGEDALNRPIIHADFVTEDDGTGLVHCAPGHGAEDFDALQDHIKSGRVKVKAPVNDKGEFSDAATPNQPSLLSGKYVFNEGNKAVLDLLRAENALITSYNFTHKYPIDWRTKQPVMIRATAQWFADISKIKDHVVSSLESVGFRPESGKSRLKSFVENRSEWCISRQRAWGVPIPALYHKHTNEAVLTAQSIDHIIDTIKTRGIDSWWSDASDNPAWIMPGLPSDQYVRGTDTMDVWFDSGTSWSHMSELNGKDPQTTPLADVYFEGSDQHRGWFQSSILTNIAYQNSVNPTAIAHAPFKQLITHGFTLDAHGKKMSKSIGNVISPDEIIAGLSPQPVKPTKKSQASKGLGPDALRLWTAMSDYTSDVVISHQVVDTVHKSLNKYRNTAKVLLGMLADFDPSTCLVSYQLLANSKFDLHRLALFHLYQAVTSVRQSMQNHEFHKAIATVNEWLANDLSAFYLEAVKDSIYCDGEDALRRRVSQTVLYHTFCQFQEMLAPVAPILVEETYEYTPEAIKTTAGHPLQRKWDDLPIEWNDENAVSRLEVDSINSAVKVAQQQGRADKLIGSSLDCGVRIQLKNGELADLLGTSKDVESVSNFWKDLLVVSEITPRSPLENEQIFKQFSTATTEEERVIVRAAVAREYNNLELEYVHSSEHENHKPNADQLRQETWSYCREVEHPTRKGEIFAYVLIHRPTMEKCDRCWMYTAPKPQADDEHALCERCEMVVQKLVNKEHARIGDHAQHTRSENNKQASKL